MKNDEHDDPERDAWLSEALRHAPDAQAAPPPALSDAILRQARAAATTTTSARAARSGPSSGAWAAVWAWLARPPVAAGFASVMVATLVGLLWWGQPLETTRMPPPASETSVAPRGSLPASAPIAVAPAPAPLSSVRRPASAPTAAAPPPTFARRLREAAPASDNTASMARGQASATASGALAPSAAKAAAPRRLDALATTRPAALSALLASVAAQPERWTWQRGDALQPMTPALQRWLVQLDGATAAHWRSAAEPAPAVPGSVLRLSRDDASTAATLRLTDDAVWFAPASRAELPRAAIDALKQALDEATR
jgi:hypothetical protein